MRKIFIFIVLLSSLFGKNIVDVYRKDGIKSVEDYLEKTLQSQSYWSGYLKNRDLSFGYYEDMKYVLVADKSKKELFIYKNGKNGLKFIKKLKIIVGKLGDKKVEGDLRTPLGVYKLVTKFKPQDQFYGPFAYALSYPNTYDKLRGKSGHGIWIHGSPLDGSARNAQSKGCIVLSNERLKKLDSLIEPKKSILIITEGKLPKTRKEDISVILSSLYRWRYAWKRSDIEGYLKFYSSKFIRFDGKRIKSFSRMKRAIFAKKEKKEIIFKDINISPYPNLEGKKLFKVSFYEKYKTKRYRFNGTKELYVELKNGKFQILAEK